MVKENDDKKGVFRDITVDGKIVGAISVEQKEDVYRKKFGNRILFITRSVFKGNHDRSC